MAVSQVGYQLGVVNICKWASSTSHATFIDDVFPGLDFTTWAEVGV